MRLTKYFVSTIVLILLSLQSYAQGLYWESTMKTENGKEINSTVSYRKNMFKQSFEKQAIIYRFDQEKIYALDNEKKEYTEMTFDELEAANKYAIQQMEQMKKQMKDLPPEQRKMMEKMMGNMGEEKEEKIEVVKTSEKKSISGFPCTKYIIKENGKETGIVWTTTKVPEYSVMEKDMKKFNKRFMNQMPKMKKISDAMNKIEGFPIQTIFDKVTMTVTKVEKKDIPLSEFVVPKDYKKATKQEIPEK